MHGLWAFGGILEVLMGLGMVGTLHCILPDSFILWITYCLAVRASRGPEATD